MKTHTIEDCDIEGWRFMGTDRQLPVRGTCRTWTRSEGTPVRKSFPSLALIVFLVSATMAEFALSQGIGAASNNNAAILINEIMYHPQSGLGQPEDIRQEYIELYNSGAQTVDLSGWRLSNGVDFVFPDVTVGAGRYLVVAADVATFKAIHPGITDVIGGWDGKLSNSGERIELLDRAGVRIDSIRYADQGDWGVRELGPSDRGHRGWLWVTEHDGRGKSMELINPAL
ncbi:MAG: lamin tail domain-containing protein, partial [Planctomycetota bacterium]